MNEIVVQKLLLAHKGLTSQFRVGLEGLERLLKGRKRRVTYETREQRVFRDDARRELEILKKKGLRIPLFTL